MELFGTFAKRTVTIKDRAGTDHSTRLLPVRLLDVFFSIMESVETDKRAQTIAEGRTRLRELALQALPELEEDFMYLDYGGMLQVVTALFFGQDEKTKKTGNAMDEYDYDYPFHAARILHVFPGYTLETLLEEPAPIFFKLMGMCDRIYADEAIELQSRAVVNGLGSKEMDKALSKIRGKIVTRRNVVSDAGYTNEEYESALKLLNAKT